MNRYVINSFIVVGLLLFSGCVEQVPLNDNNTGEPHPYAEYYLAAPQQKKRQFDMNTGAPLSRNLTELSQPLLWGAIFNNKLIAPTKLTLPKSYPTLIIDGFHALSWHGNITAHEIYFARTYAELNGTIMMERLQVGSHPYSLPTHQEADHDYAASLVIKGHKISSQKLIVGMNSFVDIKEGFYVGSKWLSAPTVSGMVIDSEHTGLIEVMFQDSQIRAPSITVRPGATLRYYDAVADVSQGLKLNSGSQLKVAHRVKSKHKNVIKGSLIAVQNSLLSFRLATFENETLEQSTSTTLRIEKSAIIDGSIVPSAWHMGNNFRLGFQKLLAAHNNQLVVIETARLYGKASLGSREELENSGDIDERKNNKFQIYLREAGKKLALKHDYNRGTISLMIIDQNVATDSNGCLPDIGSYDETEARRLANSFQF